ncbi:MAG: hypothetical protein ISS57_04800 [Anaerolineales bacterium]|nr:hypothetical protein [Anaerolineales bacterium]
MIRKNIFSDPNFRRALGVFFISGSLLALEMLYIRFVSILLFPVAAYLVISIALLGLGASGGYLSLRQKSGFEIGRAGLSCIGFSLSVLASFPFVWFAGRTPTVAIFLPLILALPMFFGGFALSLSFSLPGTRLPVLYFADLLGAGASAGLVLLGLIYFDGIQVGLLIAAAGLLASGMFSPRRRWAMIGVLLLLVSVLFGLSSWLPKGITSVSPKELKLMLDLDNKADWEYQGWSPIARVDVLSIPGDSLSDELEIPYKLVTHDGGAPTLLLNLQGVQDEADIVDKTIFGVPYWIQDNPSVLIIGLGGGPDVLAGLAAGASNIRGAEVNPEMIAIVEEHYSDFTGNPYADERVQIELIDGRHLLARSDEQFDIIQLTGVDTTVASLGANPNMAENYLYTREAFIQYLGHLNESGVLSVSFPNIEGLGLRLLTLAAEALQYNDLTPVADHVIVSEMTGYIHVLVKKSPFTDVEIAALQEHYLEEPSSIYFPLYHRLFGTPDADFIANSRILLAPGYPSDNQYSVFITALESGNEQAFIDEQPRTITPPSDNWPFFFVLDKWGFQSINYDALILTLSFLLIFSIILTILPAFFLGRRGLSIPRPLSIVVYFACLGLGFIFVEVTLIQKLSLIVGHPSYSLAVTLCSLLIASGIGSLLSIKVSIPIAKKASLAALAVAALVLIVNPALDFFGGMILVQPLAIRVLLSSLIVAIPGIFMGIPFPSGLSAVKEIESSFVPWAWGINATFTVIGTILALILALNSGYGAVLGLAAFLYLAAAFSIFVFSYGRDSQ